MIYRRASSNQKPKLLMGSKAIHRVKAVKPRDKPEEDMGIEVSNREFLTAIFPEGLDNLRCWVAAFSDVPTSKNKSKWTGQAIKTQDCMDFPQANAYFSISEFDVRKKPIGRTVDCFHSMNCIALDDVKSGKLTPSWALETSPNNFQHGFILTDPITDPELAKRLLEAIRDAALINQNDPSGNNIVRYARLPVGLNNKEKYSQPFKHVMHIWEPTLRYSLDELIDGLKLNKNKILYPKEANNTFDSYESFGSGVDVAEMTRQILNSECYYEPCLKLTSHLISSGMKPTAVIATVQGIMQAVEGKPKDWKNYYDLINDMVVGAAKKFDPNRPINEATGEPISILEEFKPFDYTTTKLTAPRYVIDGIISAEIFTIAGEAGVGKSSILVSLAAIAAHICPPEHELKPKLRRNIVYMTEDPEQVERILFAIQKHWKTGLSDEDVRERFTVIPVHRSKKEVLGELISEYSAIKGRKQIGKKGSVNVPALFVFDTAAATFSLESENDNSEVSAAISICKKACLTTRTPLWIVAHIPKAISGDQLKGVTARGAGAWTGDVNGTAFIGKDDGDTNIRYFWLGKRRFVPSFDAIAFDAKFDSTLVEDELGEAVEIPYMYGDLRKSSIKERIEAAVTAKESTLRKNIYYAVLDANDKDQPINRTGVKEVVKGSSTSVTQLIGTMIQEGTLIEYERTDKCNNNQKKALKVARQAGEKS